MKEEFRPLLRLATTTPSKACTRLRSPSTTFTLTITVSPGAKFGTSLPRRAISSFSSIAIRFILFPLVVRKLVPAGTLPVAELPVLLTGDVPANQGDVARCDQAPVSIATFLFRRDGPTTTHRAPSRRSKFRDACSADNPASPAQTNPVARTPHRPAHRATAAPGCLSAPWPATRHRT